MKMLCVVGISSTCAPRMRLQKLLNRAKAMSDMDGDSSCVTAAVSVYFPIVPSPCDRPLYITLSCHYTITQGVMV